MQVLSESLDSAHVTSFSATIYYLHTELDEEVVLLTQVLAHECNIGYETCRNMVLRRCNGEPVRNLRQLCQQLASTAAAALPSTIHFEFANGMLMVLDTLAATKATDQVGGCVCYCTVSLRIYRRIKTHTHFRTVHAFK